MKCIIYMALIPLVSVVFSQNSHANNPSRPEMEQQWLDTILYEEFDVRTLTPDEKAWMASNTRLIHSAPKGAPPYAFVNESSELEGITADLVELFEQQYGFDSIYVEFPNWNQTYQALVKGDIDYLPLISFLEEKNNDVLFSEPVMSFELFIFSQAQSPFYNNFTELIGLRVGVVNGSPLTNTLRKDHPDLDFITYNSTFDTIEALSSGEIDAIIENPYIVDYTSNAFNLDNISASAETEYAYNLTFAFHPSKPELLSLFNKFIHRIDRSKMPILMDKWNNVKIVHSLNWKLAILWSIGFAVILILLSSLLLSLSRRQNQKALAVSGKHLRTAQRVANIGSWELDKNLRMNKLSDQARIILNLAPGIMLMRKDYHQLLHDDDRQDINECWNAALISGLYFHEHRIIVNNEEKWIREIAELSFDSMGDFKSASCIIEDITESKLAKLQLIQSEHELRDLTVKLLNAQEEERRRIARELHDDFSQRLAALSINVGILELDKTLVHIRHELSVLKQGIITVATDIHGLSHRLHPSILDNLGLVDAVKSEIHSYVEREMIAVNFESSPQKININKNLALSLFRITQESLRNIAKYSEASKVQVTLNIINQNLLLQIEDDGIGFDVKQVKQSNGIGIQSMTERARLIGAMLDIKSNNSGTTVQVTLPLKD